LFGARSKCPRENTWVVIRGGAECELQEVRWLEHADRGRAPGIEFIEARFGREGIIHIPISRQLKVIEQKILLTPDVPVNWRLPIRLGQAGNTVSDAAAWSDSQQAQTFLSARTCYFAALRAEGKELVTQAADLRRLRSVITEYAEA